MRISNVMDLEVTHSLHIQSAHNFFVGHFYFILVITKYLNTTSKELFIAVYLCWDFALQSVDETQTYT